MTNQPSPTSHTQIKGDAPKIGLGIDAGGTYTDVVVFDFISEKVISKSKALTTKWDFTEGISEALNCVPAHHLEKVELVSVSTTLATNAIVENHGQKVGLLLMPPYGLYKRGEISHTPTETIQGKLEIDGSVIEPIDEDQVRGIVREMTIKQGVKAFAVSGYGSTKNPAHEIQVKNLIRKETSLGVTCGHDLSQMLNFKSRAVTAVLNARIVPYLDSLIKNLQSAFAMKNINAPIMVVKGDGTLMSAEMARERPVETIFSGPAASVAGAKKLTGLEAALVVDIGGTTTDSAFIKNGKVKLCSKGNIVANAHTHVKALDMRTKGLGGDSAVNINKTVLTIGPERVTPISFVADKNPGVYEALRFIKEHRDAYKTTTLPMQMLVLTGRGLDGVSLQLHEKEIVEILTERPYSIHELAHVSGATYWQLLKHENLLRHNIISVCGLTPTDLLHADGRVSLWNCEAAEFIVSVFADLKGIVPDAFVEFALDNFTTGLATELFKKLMDRDIEPDAIDVSPACQAILKRWLNTTKSDFNVLAKLHYPIVGIGAPAHALLPAAARFFNTEFIIPEDADVANAVGAITSLISLTKSVRVTGAQAGGFVVEGFADCPSFDSFDEAVNYAENRLIESVYAHARKAGTLNPAIKTECKNDIATAANGDDIFLGTNITAFVEGSPHLGAISSRL
mgnify:CR=1 FL=1